MQTIVILFFDNRKYLYCVQKDESQKHYNFQSLQLLGFQTIIFLNHRPQKKLKQKKIFEIFSLYIIGFPSTNS